MSAVPAHAVPGTCRVVRRGRSLAVLTLGAATMQAAVMVASTASTLMFAGAFGDRWGGLPPTAGVAGVAAGSIGLTWLMRLTGRRSGLITAYAVAAAGAGVAVAGVLFEPLLVVAGLFLLGVGNAGSQLARYAGADLYPAARQGFALSAVAWAGTIGAVGGPAMLAPATAVADAAGLPAMAGVFLLALAAAAVAGLVTTGVHRSATPVRRGGQATAPPRLLAAPAIRIALVAMVASHVVMVALMVAAPLHLDHHGHGLGAVGAVISLHVLGMYALAPLSGRLTDRYGSRRVLVAGVATIGASAVVLVGAAHLSEPWFAVALFALGYGWSMSMVAGSALLVRDVPPAERLRVQGRVEAWVWGAAALAALMSSQLLALGGYRLLATVCVALVAATVLSILRTRVTPGPAVMSGRPR
ncbi:MFS transporter [Nonomuraea jiangxiensis]|uniref:Major Facilitator Superfamily protein n=1 Tax=Nonomuraea jiangxiensis TaxID=633440 RepID=A0A1G8QSW3_9ACTN|nr:MFS transporter [Nonomuraea jiangxiensis]SDJ07824.1 Major Facilitator Superfamily protein [Nonomuraea jiangxiensis]